MKSLLRNLTPRWLLNAYHGVVTWLAQAAYGFPTRRMRVIGVTGTDGKTSTANYTSQLLEAAGYRTGVTSTALIKVGAKTRLNPYKLTMLGRWHLASLLAEMRREKTDYAIVETSSEGLAQNRHLGIAYDVAVFTNLSPEHIESHGSFEAYGRAKEKLFAAVGRSRRKPDVKKVIAANLDDEHAKDMLQYDADEKWGWSLESDASPLVKHVVRPMQYACTPSGIQFVLRDEAGQTAEVATRLVGLFNLRNALAAATVARSQGVPLDVIARRLSAIEPVPGRMEPIDAGQPFSVIVDYAHAPNALEQVYKTLRQQLAPGARLIAVLGSAGGGRDKAKRPVLGKLAGTYAHVAVVTNEDPYDEDPQEIMEQVAVGVRAAAKPGGTELHIVPERREGMQLALAAAKAGDIVVITGKGCEPVIMGPAGKRIPHDDRTVARELLAELQKPKK
ncbi:MAG: UDP-N-acetylmuramoyl-L-alanyl-D-glutamate--2,6-diaminopimelate ligase [Candidatus Andersenbacteria bacterium]